MPGNLSFWEEIESEINETIPHMLKVLFTKCGYDSRMSLRCIKLEDIISVEKYVTENFKELLKQLVDEQPEYSDLKLIRGKPFEFLPGHRKRILAIGEILTAGLGAVRENETSLQPLHNAQSAQLKGELYNNIMKWTTGKKLDKRVSKYILQYVQYIVYSIVYYINTIYFRLVFI